MKKKSIIEFLKEQREKRNITQEQLAEMVRISSKEYRDIEEGTEEMDIRVCMELAKIFEMPIGKLLEFWK